VLAGVRRSAFESRMPSLSRLGERVPLFLAGEGALGLPTAPRGVSVLPRDLTVAAELVDAVEPATPRHADDRNEPAIG
jgi:MerR family transcriptional regulator, light-induced transcriptional regulator